MDDRNTYLPPFERRSGLDRRKGKLPLFSRYWLTGRRAEPRRAADRRKLYLEDRYSSRTVTVTLLIVVLSVLDAIFTLNLVDRGAVELNPVMAYYLQKGPMVFFAVKYLLTCSAVMLVFFHKNAYVFNSNWQVKMLFPLLTVPFVLVVQWELYLILASNSQ